MENRIDRKDDESLYQLISTQYPSDKMKAHPVSRAVNSPRNNSKDLLKELEIAKEEPFGYYKPKKRKVLKTFNSYLKVF